MSWLDQRCLPGSYQALLFCIVDHRKCRSVLDASGGLEHLLLDSNESSTSLSDFVKINNGSSTNELGNLGFDLGGRKILGEISDSLSERWRIGDGLGHLSGEEPVSHCSSIAKHRGSFLEKAP